MAVAFDAKPASDGVTNTPISSPLSVTFTVGATATALVATTSVATTSGACPTCTGITWNGVAMTLLGTVLSSDTFFRSYVFGLASPATGNHTLSATYSGVLTNATAYLDGASFTGTATTTAAAFPLGDVITDASTPTGTTYPTAAFSVTTASGDAALASMNSTAVGYTGVAAGTLLRADSVSNGNNTWGFHLAAGSATTMQFTGGSSGNPATGVAIHIAQPGGGGGGPVVAPLTGLGIPRRPFMKGRGLLIPPASIPPPAPVFSTPTLIQHVATGFLTVTRGQAGNNFAISLPNAVGAGNCLVLAFTYQHGLTVTSITDNNGNSWPGSAAVSVDAGAGNYISAAYVLPNANAGVTTITVNFSGTTAVFQLTCSEFNNLASASVVNGTQSATGLSGATLSTGSFTPTTNNDAAGGNIIWNYAAPSASTVSTVAAIAAGSGFTLLDADISVKDNATSWPVMSEWFVQTTQASINPSFTQTTGGSNTFNALALALEVASGGTATPSGIHINKIIHNTSQATSATWKFQSPVTGNLLVLAFDTTTGLFNITGVTDSDGNTYFSDDGGGFAQFWYTNPVSPNPNLAVTATASGAAVAFSMRAFDIQGALSSSPKGASAGAGTSWTSSVPTHLSNLPNITPLTTNGLVIASSAAGHGPFTGLFTGAPPGAIYDLINYTGETDFDTIDNADGTAHVYLTGTTAQTWNWTISTVANDNAWATAVEFKAAASTSNYTLAGAEGAFTISGQTATELRGITSASSEGAFVISGQTAGLQVGLPGAEGVFTISGQASTELRGIKSSSSEGAFAISGQAATLNVGLPGAEGAFTISGQAAGLAVGLPGVEGAFVISGQASTEIRGITAPSSEGAFVISGQAAGLNVGLPGAEGAFVIGGQVSTELRGITSASSEGAFVIGGQTATLTLTNAGSFTLAGDEGAFAISGGVATTTRSIHLPNVSGAFTISGQSAGLALGLPAAEGAFVISGKPSTFAAALSIKGVEGAFTINGQAATLTYTPAGGDTSSGMRRLAFQRAYELAKENERVAAIIQQMTGDGEVHVSVVIEENDEELTSYDMARLRVDVDDSDADDAEVMSVDIDDDSSITVDDDGMRVDVEQEDRDLSDEIDVSLDSEEDSGGTIDDTGHVNVVVEDDPDVTADDNVNVIFDDPDRAVDDDMSLVNVVVEGEEPDLSIDRDIDGSTETVLPDGQVMVTFRDFLQKN